MMQSELRNYMLNQQSITDIVENRIYAFPAPQNTDTPYIMLHRNIEISVQNLANTSQRYEEEWQIDIFADDSPQVENLKNIVRDALDICLPVNMGIIKVLNIFFIDSFDSSELENFNGESTVNRRSMRFRIIRLK